MSIGRILATTLVASGTLLAAESSQTIHSKVSEIFVHSTAIPGLATSEFEALKPTISTTWDTLVKEGVLEVTATDQEVRPSFVALQAVVEHVLAAELGNSITSVVGFIHTPMPATPLCTKGEISPGLVDPSVASDPSRAFTVSARTTIIRDFLAKGAHLYVVYPKEGLNQRTETQQAIYRAELVSHPTHLFDTPLNCDSIPTDLIGATYFFQDKSGQTFVFAIKMTQAIAPQAQGSFGLWLGSINHPAVEARVKAIYEFIKQTGSNAMQVVLPG